MTLEVDQPSVAIYTVNNICYLVKAATELQLLLHYVFKCKRHLTYRILIGCMLNVLCIAAINAKSMNINLQFTILVCCMRS